MPQLGKNSAAILRPLGDHREDDDTVSHTPGFLDEHTDLLQAALAAFEAGKVELAAQLADSTEFAASMREIAALMIQYVEAVHEVLPPEEDGEMIAASSLNLLDLIGPKATPDGLTRCRNVFHNNGLVSVEDFVRRCGTKTADGSIQVRRIELLERPTQIKNFGAKYQNILFEVLEERGLGEITGKRTGRKTCFVFNESIRFEHTPLNVWEVPRS